MWGVRKMGPYLCQHLGGKNMLPHGVLKKSATCGGSKGGLYIALRVYKSSKGHVTGYI